MSLLPLRRSLKKLNNMVNSIISRRRESRLLFFMLASIFFLLSPCCERKFSTTPELGFKPNVLILSVESLRYDHVGCYGYSRPITPGIDALAASGTLFEKAYAQSSWTRPSIASTLTSTYVSSHMMSNPESSDSGDGNEFPRLRAGFATVASIFSDAGYTCFGWTSNKHLWPSFGFDRGFAEYNARIGDKAALDRAIKTIENREAPWLIFFHIMAPHWEYSPPPEYRAYDKYPRGISIKGDNWQKICNREIVLSREDLDHNIALYDGEIAYADNMIGTILETLRSNGGLEKTLVVITSDHGEEFLEHGGVGHGRSLYEEVIRVPLVMAGPSIPAGVRINAPVQNIDILPTIAEICGVKVPAHIQGASLGAAFTKKSGDPKHKLVFSEVENNRYSVTGVRFKYIYDPVSGKEELYDIVADPAETNNIAKIGAYEKVRIGLAENARKRLEENRLLSKKMGPLDTVKAPSEVMKSLKTLGYFR